MKYDVRFCKCGRIHMIPSEKVQNAVENDKSVLLICGSCGEATIIGADKERDWTDPTKTCYNMFSVQMTHDDTTSITDADFKDGCNHYPYAEIFYSKGVPVPMMTGENARSHFGDQFCDMWFPSFSQVQRKDLTAEQIQEWISKFQHDQVTVDMDRFIRQTPEEYLDAISGYVVPAFNWKGTKWEHK